MLKKSWISCQCRGIVLLVAFIIYFVKLSHFHLENLIAHQAPSLSKMVPKLEFSNV